MQVLVASVASTASKIAQYPAPGSLMLGRLLPDYFPKIFGKSEREPLDVDASRVAFEEIAGEINKGLGSERQLDLDEIIYGYARFLRPSALISLTQIRTDSSRSRTRRCAGRSGR